MFHVKPAGPKVMATPEGWWRLDEAAKSAMDAVRVDGCSVTGITVTTAGALPDPVNHGFPLLTFRPEEWRMNTGAGRLLFDPPNWWGKSELGSLDEIIDRLDQDDREDDIMAATREIARGT